MALALVVAAGAALLATPAMHGAPHISEFMADNVTVLADEDGDFSDWIEVTNSGPGPVSLGGWFLTDDETRLTKWEIPVGTVLAEGSSIVIFASGKDRAVAGMELHANFALAREGEVLALVEPDGTTIASRFSPYPAQQPDISYGFGFGASPVTVTLVDANAAARALVPAGPVVDAWRGGAPFDDSAWQPVQLGVGFNTEGGAVIGGGGNGVVTTAYRVAPGTSGTQAFGGALGMDFAVIAPVTIRELGVFDDDSDGMKRTVGAQLWSREGGGPGSVLASETFTAASPGTLEGGHRFKPLATPLTLPPGPYTIVAYGYGSTEQNGNSGGNGDFSTSNDGGGLLEFVGTSRFGATGGAWPDTPDGGGPARYGAGSFKFSPAGDSRIGTDLEASMHARNASVLVRVPFHHAPAGDVTRLRIEMAHDDGFAAWLNGTLVASRNAPATLAWNSAATSAGNAVEMIDLPVAALVSGDNLLAIQGLNVAAGDSDFLVAPTLTAELSQLERLYFAAPTPGAPNTAGHAGTGVVINEIHYDPRSNAAPAEFVELYNAGAQAVDLTGWVLTDAVEFAFPQGTMLDPGDYLVVALEAGFFVADFGALPVLAPFAGRLGNGGDLVELRDGAGGLVDRVDYGIGAPWPVAGDEPYPSLQLLHPGEDNDLAGSWRAAPPTPGGLNAVFTGNAPPQVRQVNHAPQSPVSGEVVVISCKVTDPDGVAEVAVEYQLVDPGNYLRLSDAAYGTSWTSVPMAARASGGGIYEAALPGTLQTHRRLVRYRVVARDVFGSEVRVPLPGDPSANFAYFVYDGVPAWSGAEIPGQTPVLNFSAATMSKLPVYHLIAREQDVLDSQYNGSYNDKVYRFEGALVYDGEVYDHMRYRIRGHGSTYNTGKNKWKLRFNRGRSFQGRDDYGRPYREMVRTLNWSALASPWNPANRGAAGLDEALAYRMWRMTGVPAANTSYFHLRIIDGAEEQSLANQFAGDNWGLYLTIEQADRRFLDERGLPDGNTFNMHFGSSNLLNEAFGQPTDRRDLFGFTGTGSRGYNRVPVQPVDWWEANVDLESYFSYRAIVEALNHSDLRDQENSILYHNPVARKWTMIPWDVDLLYEEFDRWGPNAVQSPATLEQFRKALEHEEIEIRFQNRARELQDLLLNSDQGWTLVDELAALLGSDGGSLGMAELDAARWNRDPRTRRVEGSSPDPNRYFFMNPYSSTRFPAHGRTLRSADFSGMMGWVKRFIVPSGFGGGRLATMTADSAIPATPSISYTGADGYPADGLRFSSSAFVAGSGGAPSGAIEWRVGEIRNPQVAGYVPGEPWRYEVETFWSSGEVDVSQAEVVVPPIAVEAGRTYRARVRHKGVDGRWSHWSAPLEFTAGDPALQPYLDGLVISEIMYNPAGDRQDLEFLELRNVGSDVLDLSPLRFTDGIEFEFAESMVTSVPPGGMVLVVQDLAAFEAAYGAGLPVAGEYRTAAASNLDNGGERLRLVFGSTSTIRDFSYGDDFPWPEGADGGGYSLVLIAPERVPDHAVAENWRTSALPAGTPGSSDAVPFVGEPHLDLDRDGLGEWLEHALGTDPSVPDIGAVPAASIEAVEVDGLFDRYLVVRATRNLSADDVLLEAQLSVDLVTWNGGPEHVRLIAETPNGDGTSTVTWRSARPVGEVPRSFLRIQATGRP